MKTIRIKKEFQQDYISREAGERLRIMILRAAKEGKRAEIDFEHLKIASTSFLDEGLAKLVLEGWVKKDFDSRLELKNMDPKDRLVLEKLCLDRGLK